MEIPLATDFCYASVKQSPLPQAAGLGLFADKSFQRGDVILTRSKAFAIAPGQANSQDVCAWCFQYHPKDLVPDSVAAALRDYAKPNLMLCSKCKAVSYCSKQCQISGWKEGLHRIECPVFERMSNGAPKHINPGQRIPAAFRIVLQILAQQRANGSEWQPYQEFVALKTHKNDYLNSGEKGSKRINDIKFLSQGLYNFSSRSFDLHLVEDTCYRALINSHTLTYTTLDPIGAYLDPLVSRVNHSCLPNAWINFEGRKMSLRTLTNINEGDEITISYVDSRRSTEERRAVLEQKFFFDCRCLKCVTVGPLSNDEINRRRNKAEDHIQRSFGNRSLEPSMMTTAIRMLGTDWPPQLDPYPKYLKELAAYNITRLQKWGGDGAFQQLEELRGRVDRCTYEQQWHPNRMIAVLEEFENFKIYSQRVQFGDKEMVRFLALLAGMTKTLKANAPIAFGADSRMTTFINSKCEDFAQSLPPAFRQLLQ
ncbi:MAG: hypothetical protein M1814_005731 [Vezdaea aestivalis]|nr:MAG: hypothetical protein M1814_005731 [Vezdaea aestivalis]